MERTRTPLTALGGALLGVVLILGYFAINPPDGRYSDSDIKRLAGERLDEVTPTPPPEPQIYANARPSVVLISRGRNEDDPTRGFGSGFVFDANGGILTAYHVVAGLDSVNVRFFDGSTTTATVIQRQPDRDLAVLRVRRLPNGVEPLVLASTAVHQGDKVLAIGAPFGLDGTFTAGIVSAVNRSFQVEDTGQIIRNMIQFDAAVNPGNSGGPLLDYNGNVIGIVSGIINPTDQRVFVGLSFAVPIQEAGSITGSVF
ncbi:MAG TPA: trypsin-like peptidase domain-containing protein [Dehalococcoidia bacterium]|nr:trypsin-like peptidase domain-containing protein [Dehalococcoidia bacterium]